MQATSDYEELIKEIEKLLKKNKNSWFVRAVSLIALLSIKQK